MTAPQKLPTPPSTMMRKAGMTASMPTCGRSPQIGVNTTPAKPASPAPSPNTSRRSRVRLIPNARTISLSWAPALMMAPYGVRSRNSQTATMAMIAKSAAQSLYLE